MNYDIGGIVVNDPTLTNLDKSIESVSRVEYFAKTK